MQMHNNKNEKFKQEFNCILSESVTESVMSRDVLYIPTCDNLILLQILIIYR